MATITNPLLSLLGTLAPKALQTIQAGQVPTQIPLTDADAQARDDRDIEMYKAGLGGAGGVSGGAPKTEEERSQPKLVDSAPVNPSPVPAPLAPIVNTPTENFQDLSAPKTSLTPPTKKPGKFSLPNILRVAGAVGGAMESAGNRGNAPGAEKLRETYEAQANRDLQSRRLEEVDKPQAQAHTKLLEAQVEGMQGSVPVTVMTPNGPMTYNVPKAQLSKVLAPEIAGTSREKVQDKKNEGALDVQQLKNTGAETVAKLKSGAPMTVDPELAQLAGQPDLAGKGISGATLSNFVKVLNAKGIHIQDMGDEGLWSVDKTGNRIKQVTVSSPSVARAREYSKARAEFTPEDVYDPDTGQVKAMSNLERLQTGTPKASSVVSTGKAANTVYQPALDADMRLKQMYQQATDVSGASDQALLFNHIAMTGGAVKGLRMGEYLTEAHRKARGIPESIGVLWNRLASGESLSPQQRINFVHLAESVRQTAWDRARRQAPLIGAANEPAPDPDLPELNELPSTGPVKENSPSPQQIKSPSVKSGLGTAQGKNPSGKPTSKKGDPLGIL